MSRVVNGVLCADQSMHRTPANRPVSPNQFRKDHPMFREEPHDFEAKRELLLWHCRDYHREHGTANDDEFDRFHRELERRMDRYLPWSLLEEVIDQLEVLARVRDNDPQYVEISADGTTNTRPEREAAEVDMARLKARHVLEAPNSAGRWAA